VVCGWTEGGLAPGTVTRACTRDIDIRNRTKMRSWPMHVVLADDVEAVVALGLSRRRDSLSVSRKLDTTPTIRQSFLPKL